MTPSRIFHWKWQKGKVCELTAHLQRGEGTEHCAANTQARWAVNTPLLPGRRGASTLGRHLFGSFPGTSYLVFCRLVPMCGLQDGDELPVLGVSPAANAWWKG